jgi:hypothetical protein
VLLTKKYLIEQDILTEKIQEIKTNALSVKNMALKLCSYLEAYTTLEDLDSKTLKMVRRGQKRCLDLPDMIDNALRLLG